MQEQYIDGSITIKKIEERNYNIAYSDDLSNQCIWFRRYTDALTAAKAIARKRNLTIINYVAGTKTTFLKASDLRN